MDNEVKLAAGAVTALGIATAALVVMPYIQVRDVKPPKGLKPYTSAQQRGRDVYGGGLPALDAGELPDVDTEAPSASPAKGRHQRTGKAGSAVST